MISGIYEFYIFKLTFFQMLNNLLYSPSNRSNGNMKFDTGL